MFFPGHILAGFSHGFRQRRALWQLLCSTPLDNGIGTLTPEHFKAEGVRALCVDFDGVLAPHGSAQPLPEACQWLKRCAAELGETGIFILSNRPAEQRRNWFHANFPEMRFISGVRKKPFPDGILTAAAQARVQADEVLMIDDRLLTGCLAAINAGARPCYVRRPYVALGQKTSAELFFMTLRLMERMFVRLCRVTW